MKDNRTIVGLFYFFPSLLARKKFSISTTIFVNTFIPNCQNNSLPNYCSPCYWNITLLSRHCFTLVSFCNPRPSTSFLPLSFSLFTFRYAIVFSMEENWNFSDWKVFSANQYIHTVYLDVNWNSYSYFVYI